VPSTEVRADPAQVERFLLEEWIARRVDSPHLLRPWAVERPRTALYVAMEYVEGRTLTQWMADHPRPPLEQVREIVEQIGRGLRALHRGEMLHQDLRPDNVMVDGSGTAKIIDFGAVHVAGLADAASTDALLQLPGTAQYMAPEYFLGAPGTPRSDLFSLAVIAYQLLTGNLPFGMEVAKRRTLADQQRLRYRAAQEWRGDVPGWVDDALQKALHPQAMKRQEAVSEFAHDLRAPGPEFLSARSPALIERRPVLFWQCTTVLLAAAVVVLLGLRAFGH
jgi:serine/threonine protein kinase